MQHPPNILGRIPIQGRWFRQFRYKVCHDLSLEGQSGLVINFILVQLYHPLQHSPRYVWFMQDISEWLIGEHSYGVSLEIGTQLLSSRAQSQGSLFHLRVSCFCISKRFADEINGSLFFGRQGTEQDHTNSPTSYYLIQI